MGHIVVIPLDDRPQTLGFTAPLAAIGGAVPLVPPRSLLGRFLSPGEPEELGRWLLASAAKADAVVVALDMLAYGGLIASRTPDSTGDERVGSRLEVLRRLRRDYPRLPIYAATVLMRLSITAADKESVHWWKLIHQWSELHMPETDAELRQKQVLEKQIPAELLARYQAARRRNHVVNRQAIDLVAEGVIEHLLISQEDCTERGPHRSEQADLLKHAAALGVKDQVTLCPGADEGTHVLLARAVARLAGIAPRVWTVWSDPEGAARTAPYEDRPVKATLEGLLAAAGGVAAKSPDDADLTLFVHPPGSQRVDLTTDLPSPLVDLTPFTRALADRLAEGHPCAVADVAMSNGADPTLVAHLLTVPGLSRLAGYAAWNTCANSLGTVLAHAFLRLAGAGGPRSRDLTHCEFLLERLVDDGFYQSTFRRMINGWLTARGFGHWNLPEALHRETEAAVQALIVPVVRDLHGSLLADRYALQAVQVELGWPRTFEVTVRVELAEVQQ